MVKDKIQRELIQSLAKDNGLSFKETEAIYSSVFKFIRDTITMLPIKETDSILAVRKMKSNFNIPKVGKMHVNIPKVSIIKEQISKKQLNIKTDE